MLLVLSMHPPNGFATYMYLRITTTVLVVVRANVGVVCVADAARYGEKVKTKVANCYFVNRVGYIIFSKVGQLAPI